MSRTGWWIVAVGVLYFWGTSRPGPQQTASTGASPDPLGQPNQVDGPLYVSPESAYPYEYGRQYGNTAQPFIVFQGYGANAKFTGTFDQNTGLGGDVANPYDSGSYSRIGSSF